MDKTLRTTWVECARNIERALFDLPATLDPWLVAFGTDLGRPSTADAPLHHFLLDSASAPPVLEEPAWVLGDLAYPHREAMNARLFEASYHLVAATVLEEMVLDAASRLPVPAASVAALIARRGLHALHGVIPPGDALWPMFHAREAERVASLLAARDILGNPRPLGRGALYDAAGLRWSAGEIVVAAAASIAGHRAPGAVADLARTLHRAFQIRHDVLDVGRAAEQGARTFPLVVLAEEAGIDPRAPDAPERLIGAAVMSSALPRALEPLRDEIARAAANADALALPTFASRLRAEDREIEALAAGFGLGAAFASLAGPDTDPTPPTGIALEETAVVPVDLHAAIARARAYLAIDPDLREGWEVHRWGLFGAPLLTGRKFPSAMILEQIGAAGVDLEGRADALIARYASEGFTYFDEPSPMPPDIDTLGSMLRLVPYCAHPELARASLEAPLALLSAKIPDDGDVATWLAHPEGFDAIIGADCAGCQVNLLRGLAAFDADRFAPILVRVLGCVLRKVSAVGAASLRFYTGGYLAWALADLRDALTSHDATISASLVQLDQAVATLADREARRADLGAQGAAMLLLTTPRSPSRAAWIDRVLRAQRWDGAWDDEPLYAVPRRGGVSTWYASHLATTAICHRALVRALPSEEP